MKDKKPSEIISRSVIGEIVAPLNLPPELARLSQEWEKLTYDQKVADARKRPLEDRLRLLTGVGRMCKNAIQLVREFRPLIEVCRDELSQRGRRIQGKPTWTAFIPATFGFSTRRMQQLLADGNLSRRSPRPARTEKARTTTDPKDYDLLRKVKVLAVTLASSVVEHGLADTFPEAAEILTLVDSKGKARPSTVANPANVRHVPNPQTPEQRSPLPEIGRSSTGEEVAEEARVNGHGLPPQPRCYVCGTGIDICAIHEPQVKALMSERGIGDFEASEILAQQVAKQRRGFSKTA